ncbi:MAG: hypothetical protein AAF383_09765 [Cyanobacteria bacterium P01_A01_bin.83]
MITKLRQPPVYSKKVHKLIDTTYRNNSASDYTEKIEQLCQNFDYQSNSRHYWSDPKQSLLYGSPLYAAASPTQKLALNHLHWFANYNYIANSETETVIFNQITADVFQAQGGLHNLVAELLLETEQEHCHIKTFRKIGLATAKALIGRSGLNALLKWHTYKLTLGKEAIPTWQYRTLRLIANRMQRQNQHRYSDYLHQLEQKNQFLLTAPTAGMLGRSLNYSLPVESFLGFNWGGGSMFMACHFYTIRIIANLYLKNMEHGIAKYYQKLKQQGEFIPAPTAVSRYHFLDESFHTSISQLLAQDAYRDFPQATAYEKLVANLAIYKMQSGTLGGISAVFPHRYFADDHSILELVYRVLLSPLFGMSHSDALHWVKCCFCQEHQGFHEAVANRQRLLKELRRFFADFDYLWSVNRNMSLMASSGGVEQAIQNNRRIFSQFASSHALKN